MVSGLKNKKTTIWLIVQLYSKETKRLFALNFLYVQANIQSTSGLNSINTNFLAHFFLYIHFLIIFLLFFFFFSHVDHLLSLSLQRRFPNEQILQFCLPKFLSTKRFFVCNKNRLTYPTHTHTVGKSEQTWIGSVVCLVFISPTTGSS